MNIKKLFVIVDVKYKKIYQEHVFDSFQKAQEIYTTLMDMEATKYIKFQIQSLHIYIEDLQENKDI
jgi:hypothetical protein